MPGTRDAKYSIDTKKYRKNWDDIFGKPKKDKPKEEKKEEK
jgi:hypothetical protein